MDANTKLDVGDVVQLSPIDCGNPMLAACFMIVTEPKAFGAQGYVQTTGVHSPKQRKQDRWQSASKN